MDRVLIFGMTENPGGIESFLMNYYRNINRERLQFDFLTNSYEPVVYEKELMKMGSRVFYFTARSRNRTKYKQELEEIFREHASEWSALWVNDCSLANIDYLKIAKKYGIRKRITHSHNSQNMEKLPRFLLHKWNRRNVGRYATDYWACSEKAAQWFYNDMLLKKAIIINNAIDTDQVQFDIEKRKEIRHQYGLGDKIVIGNIGRLHFQKNQDFAIDVFRQFHNTNPESVLVFIGKGDDEVKLKKRVHSYGLDDAVLFMGIQKDIQGWLSTFDLFLFPSRFEGLSVVALEAQANGVPMLASEGVIPPEVKMSDNLVFFDLKQSCQDWSQQLETMKDYRRLEHSVIKKRFIDLGFDIKTEAKKLENLLVN